MLQAGQSIPLSISVKNIEKQEVSLKDYLNQKYLLIYFYPKDDTPGCTIEACTFRDYNKMISSLGVKILGVSKDNVNSHKRFIKKFDLNFELLSDTNRELIHAFGVELPKKMFGKDVLGTKRSTFLADNEGKILKVWEEVTEAENHPEEVYNYIKSIEKNA